jgi:hypothetical protein
MPRFPFSAARLQTCRAVNVSERYIIFFKVYIPSVLRLRCKKAGRFLPDGHHAFNAEKQPRARPRPGCGTQKCQPQHTAPVKRGVLAAYPVKSFPLTLPENILNMLN